MAANPAKQKKWLLELTLQARTEWMDGYKECILADSSNSPVSVGFERIVVGDRGPYIEFSAIQATRSIYTVPPDQAYRLTPMWQKRVYYEEYRTPGGVMVYKQLRTVSYADYKVGMYYVSPWDVRLLTMPAPPPPPGWGFLPFTLTKKPQSHR